MKSQAVKSSALLLLSLILLFSWSACFDGNNSTTDDLNNFNRRTDKETFSEEVIEIRQRKLLFNRIGVRFLSDSIPLKEALESIPCGRLVLDFANGDLLILEHLTIDKDTDLNTLLQSYPTVFESQVKDLSGNQFGGVMLAPIHRGLSKTASFFYIRNGKISQVEIVEIGLS